MNPKTVNGQVMNSHEATDTRIGPLLVFDGDCGFCTRSARWIQRKLPDGVGVEPWQALDLDELGLTVDDVTGAAWWLSPGQPRPARGHEAIGRALVAANGFWGAMGELIVRRPGSWLARPVYAVIARNRHRMPGGAPACQTTAKQTATATLATDRQTAANSPAAAADDTTAA